MHIYMESPAYAFRGMGCWSRRGPSIRCNNKIYPSILIYIYMCLCIRLCIYIYKEFTCVCVSSDWDASPHGVIRPGT